MPCGYPSIARHTDFEWNLSVSAFLVCNILKLFISTIYYTCLQKLKFMYGTVAIFLIIIYWIEFSIYQLISGSFKKTVNCYYLYHSLFFHQ